MNFVNIQKLISTLNNGFNVFWRVELKDILNFCKSCGVMFEFFSTTATVNSSGPPPEGGIPMAAVSTILLSTPLHMRSISTELTYPNNRKDQSMLIKQNAHMHLNRETSLLTKKTKIKFRIYMIVTWRKFEVKRLNSTNCCHLFDITEMCTLWSLV